MSNYQQYRCPDCGAGGGHPKELKAPLCHVCEYKVTMKKSCNGKIIEDKIEMEKPQ